VIFCEARFRHGRRALAYRILKGATTFLARPEWLTYRLIRLEERNLCVEQKAPKPLTPRVAALERMDASLRRADQLAPLKQGPPADKSVPPLGQTAGVGPWETNLSRTHMKERGAIILYDHKKPL
jgi:hypothetical protein